MNLFKRVCFAAAISVLLLSSYSSFSQCTNSVPIGDTNQTFCASGDKKILDIAATGGLLAWFDSPTGGTQYNNNELLIDGVTYYADNISGGNCSPSRLAVTVQIYGEPPLGVPSQITFCFYDNPRLNNIFVSGTNIQWYDAQTGGNLLNNTDLLEHNKTYWVQQVENGCTSVRLSTTVALDSVNAPTADSVQQFCETSNPTVADLQATSIGSNQIIWYNSENSTSTLDPLLPLSSGDYWASQITTAYCESSDRTKVTVEIDNATNAGTDSTYDTCDVNLVTIDLFNLLGGTPDINGAWSGPSALTGGYFGTFNPDTNVEGVYTYTSFSSLGICQDSSATVTVTINQTSPPSTNTSTQDFCESDNPTVASLNASGNNIQWYESNSSTAPLNPTKVLVDGEDYWATQTNTATGCESDSRLQVIVNIYGSNINPVIINNNTPVFCASDFPAISDLQAIGNQIKWYDTQTDTTPLNTTDLLIDGEDYWATQIDPVSGCESTNRVSLTVTLTDFDTPIISPQGDSFCKIDNPTLFDLNTEVTAVTNGSIVWYDSFPNGNILSLSTPLIDGANYLAVETNTSGCSSSIPLNVTVTLDACDAYDLVFYDGFSPTNNSINDTYKVENIEVLYPDFIIEYFDRWGNKVYTSNSSKPSWNGEIDGTGELAQPGVYFYVVNFNKDNKAPIQKRLYLSK